MIKSYLLILKGHTADPGWRQKSNKSLTTSENMGYNSSRTYGFRRDGSLKLKAFGMWRSLVERLVWERETGFSHCKAQNPEKPYIMSFSGVFQN